MLSPKLLKAIFSRLHGVHVFFSLLTASKLMQRDVKGRALANKTKLCDLTILKALVKAPFAKPNGSFEEMSQWLTAHAFEFKETEP